MQKISMKIIMMIKKIKKIKKIMKIKNKNKNK